LRAGKSVGLIFEQTLSLVDDHFLSEFSLRRTMPAYDSGLGDISAIMLPETDDDDARTVTAAELDGTPITPPLWALI
jgi:hypothetical protein